jgi:cardiolipin synthase (CMP-forming)
MKGTGDSAPGSSAILTVPNVISFIRIALIPVFFVLIVNDPTTFWGLVLFGLVVATDWVDGLIARRTGAVSELGKILDPVADRLSIAAGLIAFVVRGVFPLWAAVLILVRDILVLVAGLVFVTGKHLRVDVRWIGKVATFSLMCSIPWIAWGNLGYVLAPMVLVAGWVSYAVGIAEYYVAAFVYLGDIRRALAA